MELIELISILSVLGVVSGVSMTLIFRYFPTKSPKKGFERTISDLQKVQTNQMNEIIDQNVKTVRGLNATINKMRKEGEEELVDNTKVTWKDVKPILSAKGINPLILEIPMIEEYANKFLKGKTIEEVAQLAETLPKLLAGNGGLNLKGLFSNKESEQTNEGEFGQFPKEFR